MTLGKNIGLMINTKKKPKLMKVQTRKGESVTIGGEELEEVEQFTYLGSVIRKTVGTYEDINARICKARQAFAMLKPVSKSNVLSENTKVRIFNTNVKSVLFYGCETWRLTAGLQYKIQVFINKCLRHICKVWWPRKITNKQLLDRTNQDPAETHIKKRAWQWIGHTWRKPQNSITREALDWNPQGQRKRGRPSHSWKRTRMKELDNIGKTWGEAKKTAQNRERATVVALYSTRSEED